MLRTSDFPNIRQAHIDDHTALHKRHNAEFWAEDYGADGAAVQSAIDACRDAGGGTIRLSARTYECADSLDLTEMSGFRLVGVPFSTVLLSRATGRAALDLCGARYYQLENIVVQGHGTDMPACGILSSRTAGHSAGLAAHVGVRMIGSFEAACWYWIGSEATRFDGCATTSIKVPCVFHVTDTNDDEIPSYATPEYAVGSTSNNWFEHSALGVHGDCPDVTMFHLAGPAPATVIRDSWFNPVGATGCSIRIGYGPLSGLSVANISVEGGANAAPVFLLVDGGVTLRGCDFRMCSKAAVAIRAGTGSRLERCSFDHVYAEAGEGTTGLELYDLYRTSIRRWWSSPTMQATAHDAQDCELWVPPDGAFTVSNVDTGNQRW